MRRTHQIFAVAMLILGLALIAYGVSAGLWPPTVQAVAGALLVVMGALRLRYS